MRYLAMLSMLVACGGDKTDGETDADGDTDTDTDSDSDSDTDTDTDTDTRVSDHGISARWHASAKLWLGWAIRPNLPNWEI